MPNVIDYHIGRLRDKNAEVRRKSAIELGLIGDLAALEVLEAHYRTEDDPAVKQAMQEAGRAIFLRHKDDEASSGA